MDNVVFYREYILKNFKGIERLTVEFDDITNIYGDNKLGKTTIFDAFTWLLFDKDSKDRSKFEVQPLDKENNVVHMLETEVSGALEVNGKNMELRKILKERWIKKRGEVESEFKGTETLYYINQVPLKLSEYREKIGSIIDEQLFKLISNPLYFSLNMKWQDRRKVIIDIIGDITSDRVINYNPSLEPLIKILNDTDIDSFKKVTAARKKKLIEDKKSIPYRVDELNNSLSQVDFQAVEFRKRGIISGIKSVKEKLGDSSKINENLLKEKDRLYQLKSKLRDMEFKLNEEFQQTLIQFENKAYRIKDIIENDKSDAIKMEKELEGLRDKFNDLNKEELKIPENEFCCPTCKRAFDAEDIEVKKKEITDNFNENKAKSLQEINDIGTSKKKLLEKLQKDIQSSEAELEVLNTRIIKLKGSKEDGQASLDLSQNAEYQELKADIEELEKSFQQPMDINQNILELKSKKEELESELEKTNSILAFKEQNIKIKARIKELEAEEKDLAEKISELETQEYLCEEYTKTKVEILESGINSKFKFVRFKLFNTLVNGAVEECCEALINGVPFSNANTASQINAGIDIINALCEYYQISAPVFIDNRESINEILDCNSQIINLIVSKDKKLVINKEFKAGNFNNSDVGEGPKKDVEEEKPKQGPDF